MVYHKQDLRITLIFEEDDMTYKTEKKLLIADFLKKNKDKTFTIDEIVYALSPSGAGKSTYYRIISSMVKDGAIRKITDAHSRHTTYQYLGGGECHEHLHLKCKECGRLIHLDHETTHLIEEKIILATKFTIDGDALIFGICRGCEEGIKC